ncbi:HAD family hydrolase [Leifsonia sp. LS-T14]|uniref:HAD family hydrolase n=1 Tax=unclassified Leifsonia TaxID=2663824 RepID=UPI0035A61154
MTTAPRELEDVLEGSVEPQTGPSQPASWLLLDIGGVLEIVDDSGRAGSFASRWAPVLGLTAEEFTQRIAEADLPDAARNKAVADAYWRGIGGALGASPEQLASMRCDFWDDYCGVANDELLAFLGRLQGQVGLAILSNSGDGAREEEERRYGFSRVFDPICYSHEIGVTKPDAGAFHIALDQMGAQPSGVLFIDDVADNVAAARRLGMRAHLHVDNATTIAAVRAQCSD